MGGKSPNPKCGTELQPNKRKVDPSQVIPIEDDDEKKKKRESAEGSKAEKEKPNIFTAEVALPKESIVAQAKEKEDEKKKEKDKKKPEEKKVPKKDHKEKKEKKEKKTKKEKKDEGKKRATAEVTDME